MIETTTQLNLNFTNNTSEKNNIKILPAVIQDEKSKKVLLIAYLNEEALQKSIDTKILTLWSRTRGELWVKGATSGNYFHIKKIFVNCEQNSLLFSVKAQKGGICHTKGKNKEARSSCFYRILDEETKKLVFCE
jgi:phosphoribosyl-AMP cyclohydrolase